MVKYTLILLAWVCSAQVQVCSAIIPHKAACRLLNRRAAGIVSPWIGTARNMGSERVLVTEGAIIAQMIRLQPLDHQAMGLLVSDAVQHSLLEKLAGGGQDITAFAAFIASQKNWGSPWLEVLTGVVWGGPYLVNRIRGTERPVSENFTALASGWPIQLAAGQSSVFHVFTSRWPDTAPAVEFTLSVGYSVGMAQ